MPDQANTRLVETVRTAARPHTSAAFDDLLELAGDARVVLIGEASHGTHEFYQERAELTKRLIAEKGFTAVAVEADWPDAYRVNCYVHGSGNDAGADEALSGFKRFPTWMWRNTVVLDFVEWLRTHNQAHPATAAPAGFYGLDLYSLFTSIDAVIAYLDRVDPEAARSARERYACFDHAGREGENYGVATAAGLVEPCEAGVVQQLVDLQRQGQAYVQHDGPLAEDDFFFAEQNARLVKDAEAYYRTMFRGNVASWNLRDRHMVGTLDALIAHLERHGSPAKVVVWAHNSHLGDARATEMGEHGELNVGQLVRERYGAAAFLMGFTTYSGTVTAASDWGGAAERKQVRPGLAGSYEALFHAAGLPSFLLSMHNDRLAMAIREPLLERAIGVIYRPESERLSHYFYARLADQFDAVVHYDETCALEPLERTSQSEMEEVPETFPFAI